MSLPSPQRAVAELIFAASLWGFGFIGQAWLLTAMGPMWGNGLRFFVAFVFGSSVVFFSKDFRRSWNWEQARMAIFPGITLATTILFQTGGLIYTSVTKASFITVLYVVFVPILNWLFYRRKVAPVHMFCVALALVGIAMICQLQVGNWNRGDAFVLVCSLSAALHIMSLDFFRKRIDSGFVFNLFQTFWAGVVSLSTAVFFDKIHGDPMNWDFISGLLMLSVGSTIIAFSIQIRAQRVLSPLLVSMLFLLESPFASFFAYFIFHDRMVFTQWMGAALILVSAGASVALELPRSRKATA